MVQDCLRPPYPEIFGGLGFSFGCGVLLVPKREKGKEYRDRYETLGNDCCLDSFSPCPRAPVSQKKHETS